jgi:predicted nucleic acid-binding protein
VQSIDGATALAAGKAFKDFRRRGGTQQRVLPDFLVGAHARVAADPLLTRDRGFYGSHVQARAILGPSSM